MLTPLHVAAMHGRASCLRALVRAGCDLNSLSKVRRHLSDSAAVNALLLHAMLLFAHALRPMLYELVQRYMTALHYAAVHDNGSSVLPTGVTNKEGLAECVRVLVRAGADVDVQDEVRPPSTWMGLEH